MGAVPGPLSGFDRMVSSYESSSIDRDAIDLESGLVTAIRQEDGAKDVSSSAKQGRRALDRGSSGFAGVDRFTMSEEAIMSENSMPCHSELPMTNVEGSLSRRNGEDERESLSERKSEGEKMRKKNSKKPPKPPRPPNSPSVDAADQKLIREISELAMMKRARIERMKKKMKNAKSTSSNGNLCPLFVTVLFCLVILWQGASSGGNSNVSFHGNPESAVRVGGGLISVHFHKNASVNAPKMSSASPIFFKLLHPLLHL